jgi:alcohol dehydrogenase, propanol-preferring
MAFSRSLEACRESMRDGSVTAAVAKLKLASPRSAGCGPHAGAGTRLRDLEMLPDNMNAMVCRRPRTPLEHSRVPVPEPAPGQVLLQVAACGVCRTDLHIVDGELPDPKLPIVPGHEVVGRVAALGRGVERFREGERVGVPWLGWTCGICSHCRAGRENLCDAARFTGYQIDGGYAEYCLADERYCFAIHGEYSDAEAAPLLCAGLIGYRALGFAGDANRLGIYGFGAAAHIVTQVARHQGREVYAFTRPGDVEAQAFARELGGAWAGPSDTAPPELLDAALLFAPVGALVPAALAAVVKGGVVVCAGIHMSDIPAFPYHILWGERSIRSVANLTRADGEAFLALAPRIPVRTSVEPFPLSQANAALERLRNGRLRGAAVLMAEA